MARASYETPDPRDPASYPYWHVEVLRFADLDVMRHINNVVFASLFESARIEFWRAVGIFPFSGGEGFMQVRAAVDYLQQLHYPDTVRIGSRVMRVGEKSASWRQGMFNGKGVCVAVLEATSAYMDYGAARSKPIPPQWRASLEAEIAKPGAPLPALPSA
ncbi:MAG: acyl-CoA thioesterase [Alphaproteobacteria bacterium]